MRRRRDEGDARPSVALELPLDGREHKGGATTSTYPVD
jgi:hypothetical protein